MHPTITWILVADGQRARIVENGGPGKGLQPVTPEPLVNSDPPSRNLGTDRPGRVSESVGGARHAIEPRTDPHRDQKRRFAQELADRLDRAAGEGAYTRLILVAPPQMLGDLRDVLTERARALVAAEIDKDLTKADDRELKRHLDAVIVT
ncbi:protein required for attachment to host cells [Constrictibacter sp. MBR-5]|jgi:protein required for attachment to host cells|uniref:host attachment protein n=1 Tax=Constrictibacter sp. MBR-5 TaxID=3156467 RepID=UPI003397C355